MTTKAVYGLIVLTSAILTVANLTLQAYVIAGIAILSGAIWLFMLVKTKEAPHSFFFVVFLGLTILGSLYNVPVAYMLLALTCDIAAWDIGRFQARIVHEEETASKTLLELKHLQRLALTLSVGFVVSLLPTFIHFSLSFVVFLVIILVLVLTLRKSILNLRQETRPTARFD